jgi:hypothetical protein
VTQVSESVDGVPRALTALREARRVSQRPAGAAMTPQKIAVCHRASGSVEALRCMPLEARVRIESEANALLVLLAQARRRAGGDGEIETAIAALEQLVAQIQAELVTARM